MRRYYGEPTFWQVFWRSFVAAAIYDLLGGRSHHRHTHRGGRR